MSARIPQQDVDPRAPLLYHTDTQLFSLAFKYLLYLLSHAAFSGDLLGTGPEYVRDRGEKEETLRTRETVPGTRRKRTGTERRSRHFGHFGH